MPRLKKISLFLVILLAGLTSRASIDSVEVYSSLRTVCADSCDGQIIVQVFSSTSIGPFRIVWRGNNLPGQMVVDTAARDTIFNLCPGDYSVEVEDLSDNSKKSPLNVTISNALKIAPEIAFASPTCHDSLNGSINIINVNHGSSPYHIQWSTNPNDTFPLIDSLAKGIYGLTIVDNNGCLYSDSFKLKAPDSLGVYIGGNNVNCKNACDGVVFANPKGGTLDYEYLWNNSDTNQSQGNLCPGKFIVTVTDSNGCTSTDSIVITEPDSLKSSFIVADASCNNTCDAEVTSLVTGGTRPLQYHWSSYTDNDSVLNNACSGLITATITDANGCYYAENILVSEPDAISIQPTVNASTCGICDGDISVSVSGGSGPFHFLWIGQKAQDTISTIDSLCPGIYQLAVTDNSGCSDTFNIALSDDTSGIKDIVFSANKASCADVCDGAILASPLGGISPYSYSWSPGGQSDSVITGICAGLYSIEITDGSGCKRVEEITLESESNIWASYSTDFEGCQGDCGGSISLDVKDGVAPYSFNWLGSASLGSNASNLCAGSYSFKITDDNGCVYRDTVVISDPDTIGINSSIINASCHSSCDGSISVTMATGHSPFSYRWSNGESTSSIGNLCAGSYWVDITDANNCTKRFDFIVGEPSEIYANATVFKAECDNNNGSIKLNTSGGTGPYSYCWFNQTYADSVSGLSSSATPYWVAITDSNGCSKTENILVSAKNGPDVSFVISDESCANSCDGIITINTNYNGIFNYTLNPGVSTTAQQKTYGGLCAGTYIAGIETLVGGCAYVEEVEIKAGAQIAVAFDINNPTCNGSCDGSIIANISGGLPPYNISWSNASTQKAISGLCAGTYTINVSDASGCSFNEDIILENPNAIQVQLSTANLTCYDVCNGKITANLSGGSPPYTYLWSTGGNGISADNLCEGSYWLTVTDVNGCSGSDTIAIGNGVPIAANFTPTPADCGQCNGALLVSPSAGNGQPYTFSWSTGAATSSITDLAAGIYSVTVSDNLGCSQEFSTTLNNIGGPSLSDTTYSASCNGSCDGAAKALASGATSPYFYQWYDPLMQSGDSISALCAGTYNYSATDSNGCLSFSSVSIIEPSPITIDALVEDISCPGESDASITVNVSGGVSPYSYLWSNGDTLSATDSLSQGIYSVVVTDTSGCINSDTFNLSDPPSLSIAFQVFSTSCFGNCDGLVIANVSAGTAPYSYAWNDPSFQTTDLASGLCAGYVSLTATDANGCQFTDSALVSSPAVITAGPTLNNPTCEGGDNGSISLVLGGGSPPYTVSWNDNMTGTSISGLTAGTYTVTVIDSNQCVFQDSYLLNNPATPLSLNVNVTAAACGQGNGAASAIATNGSGSYSFSWNTIPSKTGSSITGLWPGVYEVTVSDNITGCSKTKMFIVNNAGGPTLTFSVIDEKCDSLGQAKVSPGTGKFTFLWDDPLQQTDSTAFNLSEGLYTVRVEDTVSGCVSIDTVRIGGPIYVNASIQNIKNLNCAGDCDGQATIMASAGTPPYSYSWSTVPVQTMPTAIDLCSGQYIGAVTDSLGCSEQVSVSITDPDTINIGLTIINDALCFSTCTGSARVAISGGSGPYAIYWNGLKGSDVATSLCPGANTVEVIDNNGCSKIMSFDIMDASAIMANAIVFQPNCGMYDGSIKLSPSGGAGPYFYSWSNGASTDSVGDLFAGIYVVDITDANGCSKKFSFFLNNPNAPGLNFDKNTVKCNGDCNGVARVSPFGGVAPYTYLWDHAPVSTLDSLIDLCSGVYFVKVTDATGCISFGSDTITEPPVLSGNLNKLTDGCGGLCEGEAEFIALGGTAPYSYSWNSNPPQGGATATGLCAGTVQIILTDANDCVVTDSVSINPPPALLIDSTIVTNATCFTNSDGEATVYFQGGTAPHQIDWSNAQTTQTATALNNGTYFVLITDTNNCTASDTVVVGVQDTVLVSAFVDTFVCIGNQTLLFAEGQGASIFQWFEDSSGTLLPIASGDSIYYTVTDSVTIYLRGQNSVTPPCFDLDTAFIIGIPPPVIVASSATPSIEEGSSTELIASPYLFNGSYAWSPSEGLNDTATIAPLATPTETTTYTVIGTNEFGCFGSDTVTITVIKDKSIINGFSPNGDGVNDLWEIPSLKDYPKVIVEVYNRWGAKVFRSEGYKEPWDGTFEGEKLPNASYYFVIDYYGNGEKVETGAVTILY